MFEQSMCVVSRGGVAERGARWTFAGSVVLQSCVAALVVLMPMLHPERMLVKGMAPQAFVPLDVTRSPEVKVKHVEASSSSPVAAVAASPARMMTAPARIPQEIGVGDPPPASLTGAFDGMGTALPGEIARVGVAPRAAVAAGSGAKGPVRVSSGVGAGMLVTPMRPVYPQIARAAHVEGTVVVAAVISREGVLERARVVSGPALLASAALDAVKTARYTPYRLNGEAIEVETTITVNFRLGG